MRYLGLVVGVLLLGAFLCFWFAEASGFHRPFQFEDGQWRLLGFSCLAIAAGVSWRRVAQRGQKP